MYEAWTMKAYDLVGKRVWVAGERGMVGSALTRRLASTGAVLVKSGGKTLDLRRQQAVEDWLASARPDAVFLAAAAVGGIEANRTRPAEFLYDNLAIAANVIHGSAETGVERLTFLGSSCFYPREAEQPVRESALLEGPLEPTNEAFAVAKIAGARLCQAYSRQYKKSFIVAVPTNLYGPGDNFDPAGGHVVAGLLWKFHAARQSGAECVEIWGTGKPRREFLYVDDAADALVFLTENYSEEGPINVAGGEEVSIADLATLVAEAVGYRGGWRFDISRPDGMPRKVLDGSRLRAAGWRPATGLREGIAKTYAWLCASVSRLRGVTERS
jgi:GDP-L-fucose synthase